MIQIDFKKIAIKIIEHIEENWGSPFIVGFILFLASAALLFSSNPSFADSLAVFSYYALVVGIFLQLISFLRHRGKIDDEVFI